MNSRIVTSLCVLCAILSAIQRASAQGPLSPPGPPGPTMITLSQIESRTPISALPSGGFAQFLITQSGSYYLTTNVISTGGAHGINISASNVSLDLNGFSLVGISNSYDGIYIHSGYHNIAVRNGIISSWGAGASAVNNPGAGIVCYANNSVFEHLILYNNSPSNGIDILAYGCSVVDCTANGNTGYGIYVLTNGTVRNCTTDANSLYGGIFVGNDSVVLGCDASANLNGGDGIDASTGCIIKDCVANDNNISGITFANSCLVQSCVASGNGEVGIFGSANSSVIHCTANGNIGDGISVTNNNNVIVENTCISNMANGVGILGVQNRVDGNNVGYNTLYGIFPQYANVTNSITRNFGPHAVYGNYAGNSDYAPTGTPATATSPWANF